MEEKCQSCSQRNICPKTVVKIPIIIKLVYAIVAGALLIPKCLYNVHKIFAKRKQIILLQNAFIQSVIMEIREQKKVR